MVTWISALKKTRKVFQSAVSRVVKGPEDAAGDSLEELEEALITADISPRLTGELIGKLEKSYRGMKVSKRKMLRDILVGHLEHEEEYRWDALPKDACILVVGVNGSGKTTTCAKLARLAMKQGVRPLLGAADTFRAAGSDQLVLWAEKVGCEVVSGKQGADAAAVAYDTVDAAMARGADINIIDTAGRMHTKQPLMEELRKMRRSVEKRNPEAPHETWIVLDASIGQNAILQARVFHEAVPRSGIVITKLDGSSKAGFIFSVKDELNVPIHFVGLGEQEDDLVPFDAESFVDAILMDEETASTE